MKEKATAQKGAATARAANAAPESARDGVLQAATQARQIARENPIPTAAIGAFVGGLAIGWLARR